MDLVPQKLLHHLPHADPPPSPPACNPNIGKFVQVSKLSPGFQLLTNNCFLYLPVKYVIFFPHSTRCTVR